MEMHRQSHHSVTSGRVTRLINQADDIRGILCAFEDAEYHESRRDDVEENIKRAIDDVHNLILTLRNLNTKA